MRIIVHIWTVSCNETVLENYAVLVYVYYTHPGYQTSICGKSCVYYIRIFTVSLVLFYCVCNFVSLLPSKFRDFYENHMTLGLVAEKLRCCKHCAVFFGSQPSDHYFRSVCWFVCLSVCLCRVFLSRLWSDFDQTRTYVICLGLVVSPRI